MDPLLDDSIDLVQKLRRVRTVDAELTVLGFRSLLIKQKKLQKLEYSFEDEETPEEVCCKLLFFWREGLF